ncbi:SGNH/GDSL hydrolase family protein [Microbacterium sp. cx-55]|uniref:SGNH/GDSL hydrolase family protein n=1 Tax=unclassified Microbacterium TaxID=2609290 RepID=UPI001CBD4E83|nr:MULTISPECIES: SGNH/GDSL hydrolase family protein [unclassified Microbacterium]MBZ4488669.1 SGNH/GDSL hydrolase family protein [Microbacterium sp. cx-55]MCC4909644.1 SGNH/GDSL hydrolase family protein [Microbacterium sp. cx-59]UGB36087.1 SGNH/GDSL hydrolase family protein [Microbacterium sp. cx-55]
MARPSRARARRSLVALSGFAAAIAVVCALALWHPWAASDATVGRAEAVPAEALAVAPLVLPENPRVLVFGDSWTYGSAATVPTDGYAYVVAGLIRGETIVDGVRGSGYLVPGLEGIGTFGERIARLDPDLDPDLIVVQGSINDRREPAEGYADAVGAAWDALTARYPSTPIVILGPAPQVLPVEDATARIDRTLAGLAASRGWAYISPVTEQWISPADYGWIIDTGEIGRNHPTTAGHAYLAERLARALASLAPAS